jgi:L-2-hydroxyglutarate oxidase LhgO
LVLETETVVIGAGVVGLACAAALADSGREVLVLERNAAIGEETSARNSEVIHAGIYYPPGSLKARLCVAGKARLYDYCDARGIPVKRIGKLIVAGRDDDLDTLSGLASRGRKNGVCDLEMLGRAAARNLEPALECRGALLSPSTGIVDTHQLMLSLLGECESLGGLLSLNTRVRDLRSVDGAFQVRVDATGREMTVSAREVVNCAGHQAVALASGVDRYRQHDLPEAYYTRGNYFRARGGAPFSRLIYPVPETGGLGIHLALDLAGNARFGPDVEPVTGPDVGYVVDPRRAAAFYASIRRYWPDLPDGSLLPDYAGIRPKIRRPGRHTADFEILGLPHHGIPGLVHCLGIESPGLTASLAIADEAVRLLVGVA